MVLLDNDEATLVAAEQALRHEGVSAELAIAVPADVSHPQQVEAAVKRTIDHFGRIDALVNNAGVAVFKPIGETSFHEWRTVMATNLDGAFLMTQAVVPVMLEQGSGAVVNIASISGLRASTLRVAYGTSKAALIHLTKQQAVEYGNAGIRVNAIAPGPVETAMAKAVHTPAIRADYHDTIPLARYGSEEEIAQFCQMNYGVSFPMFAKVDVNGKNTHPVIQLLKDNLKSPLGKAIKWNFTKFLIGPDGTPLKRYEPTVAPEAIEPDIQQQLP